jgi:hypothetical protein
MASQELSFSEMVVLVQVAITERKSAQDLNHPIHRIPEVDIVQAVEIYTWVEKAAGKFDGFTYEKIDDVIDMLRRIRIISTDYFSGNTRIL